MRWYFWRLVNLYRIVSSYNVDIDSHICDGRNRAGTSSARSRCNFPTFPLPDAPGVGITHDYPIRNGNRIQEHDLVETQTLAAWRDNHGIWCCVQSSMAARQKRRDRVPVKD